LQKSGVGLWGIGLSPFFPYAFFGSSTQISFSFVLSANDANSAARLFINFNSPSYSWKAVPPAEIVDFPPAAGPSKGFPPYVDSVFLSCFSCPGEMKSVTSYALSRVFCSPNFPLSFSHFFFENLMLLLLLRHRPCPSMGCGPIKGVFLSWS